MSSPLVPTTAFAGLRRRAEAAMVASATFETITRVRLANGEQGKPTWTAMTAVDCTLSAAGARAAQKAAALGKVAQWIVKVPVGTTVGERALIRGSIDPVTGEDVAWQRLVRITVDLSPALARVMRRLAAVDEDLSP